MTDPRPEAVEPFPAGAPAGVAGPPPADPSPAPLSEPRRRRSGRHGARRPPRKRSFAGELPVLILVAVGLALLIKTFLVQAFFIPSGSMERTLMVGDRVLVNKVVYDFRSPHRGEIVVFDGSKACAGTPAASPAKPCTWPTVPLTETLGTSSSGFSAAVRKVEGWIGLGGGDHDFIKRVVAIGGDTVSCPGSAANPDYCAHLVVDGVPLDETGYLYQDNHVVFGPVAVPQGQLWVMGDHRGNSSDSRDHGSVAVSSVIGRAFITVWPLSRIGGHRVPRDFDARFPQPAASAAAG